MIVMCMYILLCFFILNIHNLIKYETAAVVFLKCGVV